MPARSSGLKANKAALLATIREVRTCFNLMKTLAEQMHRDLGVSPSMRAVMESLAQGGAQTVPDIAASKGVSRQHIQTIMNGLVAEGLADGQDNPAHRRSPLYSLTERGARIFAAIAEREKEPLERLARAVSPRSLAIVRGTLARLNQMLIEDIRKDEHHDEPA